MHVNLGIWDKLTKLVILLLFLAGLAGVFLWYLPLIQENERFRRQILQLESKIHEQERYARYLDANIKAVQNDKRTIERLARERLNYARPNEIVIHFEPPKH